MLPFKLYWRQVTIAGMETLSVVEHFDVVEDGFFGGFTGGSDRPVFAASRGLVYG